MTDLSGFDDLADPVRLRLMADRLEDVFSDDQGQITPE